MSGTKLYVCAILFILPWKACAADLSSLKTLPEPLGVSPTRESPLRWSGPHLGLVSGYATQNRGAVCVNGSKTCSADVVTNIAAKPAGLIAGFEAGYDLRLKSDIVLGVEADLSLLPVSKTATEWESAYYYHSSRSKYAALGTLRGRAGYVFSSALMYVTGGLALAQVEDSFSEYNSDGTLYASANDGIVRHSAFKFGWALGAGAEYAFSKNWSVKGEYLHTQFAPTTMDIGTAYYGDRSKTGYIIGKYRHSLDIFRTGLAYSF